VGTVLGIFPWNFPFWQILRSAIPVIASGNTMIIKPAPNTILCSMALQNIIEQCGYPIGVYTTLIANETDVANIISDDRIAACTLTGSEAAGSAVATLSGKYIKKSVLELGGSDPFIITETANLPVAASKAVQARFQNTGQSCIAAKRLIVHQNIYAEFLGLFLAEVKQLKLGSPLDAHTTLGPMARKDLVNTIHSQVNDALSKGAQILYQHLDVPAKGFFYPPTVISKIQPNMRMYHEEVFGPVFALYTYNSIDELINIANDNRYGLGATVWSDDKNTALNIASELACGQVFINEILRSDARFPFGGTKKSGFGRELGPNGFFEFCYTKTINLASHS
jgi:succinate-semialdehyde dehydrogenase/glutarate-semialdehyde dehydrogenase